MDTKLASTYEISNSFVRCNGTNMTVFYNREENGIIAIMLYIIVMTRLPMLTLT